jgi:CHAT domain-containing protein
MSDGSPKPVILLAFANDRDDRVDNRYLRNLPEEARRLEDALGQAQDAGLCQVIVRQNATLDRILDVFQHRDYRNRVALFHYGGHANSYQLLFETVEGKPAAADAAGLAAFLGGQTGLELVFLNGCSTQDQAQGLLDAGVSAVIATTQAVVDEVATEFAARFYRGLASGATISTAFKEAEASVQSVYGKDTRNLYPVAVQETLAADRLPWGLHPRDGAEGVVDWNLPDAADNPLFGLPLLPELDLPESPYRHLNWYRRADAAVFFGRGRDIRDLYERVTAPRAAPIILLYGQAGVGKSSLLAAGLLPRLERDHAIRYTRRDQALGLLGTLQEAVADGGDTGDLAAAWQAIVAREDKPLVVVLDQMEEAYSRPNEALPDELGTFLSALEAWADPGRRPQGKLILGFRKEWLAEIQKQMVERKLPRATVFLQRLDRRGIVEVVTGPTRSERLRQQYGLILEEKLLPGRIAEDLLADRSSPVAAMLQILLTKMWERARGQDYDRPQFDQALYDELRKQGLALSDFLDQQLVALRAELTEAVDSGLALDLLAYHTTPLGTAEQRVLAHLEETYHHRADVLPGLLQRCQDLYLLVDPAENQPDRPAASRLAHDTLAPIVRDRFSRSERPGQVARRILENRVREWDADADSPLLDRWALARVEAGVDGMRGLTGDEKRLIELSQRWIEPELRRITWELADKRRRLDEVLGLLGDVEQGGEVVAGESRMLNELASKLDRAQQIRHVLQGERSTQEATQKLAELEALLGDAEWAMADEIKQDLEQRAELRREMVRRYEDQIAEWQDIVQNLEMRLREARRFRAPVIREERTVLHLQALVERTTRALRDQQFGMLPGSFAQLEERKDEPERLAAEITQKTGAARPFAPQADLTLLRSPLVDQGYEYTVLLRTPSESGTQGTNIQGSSMLVDQDRQLMIDTIDQVTSAINLALARQFESRSHQAPEEGAPITEQADLYAMVGPEDGIRLLSPVELGDEPMARLRVNDLTRDVGDLMYRLFLPEQMQRYLRDTPCSLTITTNDLELPWELMWHGDQFFCLERPVARMPMGQAFPREATPPSRAGKKLRFLLIADPTGNLPSAGQEVQRIREGLEVDWNGQIEIDVLDGEDAQVRRLNEVLRAGTYDVIHYAGHAVFDYEDPDLSGLLLHDKGVFFAQSIRRLLEGRPLVFLNACQSGRTASETGPQAVQQYLQRPVEGLASSFIDGGALGCIGAVWPIYDRPAAEFAIDFYGHVLEGYMIGEAMRRTRIAIRDRYPNNITWAAFTLYGHPTSQLVG